MYIDATRSCTFKIVYLKIGDSFSHSKNDAGLKTNDSFAYILNLYLKDYDSFEHNDFDLPAIYLNHQYKFSNTLMFILG